MCMFSAAAQVADTQIFARGQGPTQFLAYSMQYESLAERAMILPLPTPPHAPADALRFIDLSGYPKFFEDLRESFYEEASFGFLEERLTVQEVGNFEASFVPHQRDFARLDPRFRLAENVWAALPQYADYGFAVFKLKSGAKEVHPMAFEFPRRNPHAIYFPTVHVHDGTVQPQGDFDHRLFCQTAKVLKRAQQSLWEHDNNLHLPPIWQPEAWLPEWQMWEEKKELGMEVPADARQESIRKYRKIQMAQAQGLVHADQPISMLPIWGLAKNEDVWVEEAA